MSGLFSKLRFFVYVCVFVAAFGFADEASAGGVPLYGAGRGQDAGTLTLDTGDFASSTTYSTATTTTWVVPAGVTEVLIKAWGAGGGEGGFTGDGTNSYTSWGGGGGYAQGILEVTPGQELTVTVGGGGAGGTYIESGSNDFGAGGGGGGYSAVSSSSQLILVAGGGGGGGTGALGTIYGSSYGGGGGGLVGDAGLGTNYSTGAGFFDGYGGGAGTQSAGGIAATSSDDTKGWGYGTSSAGGYLSGGDGGGGNAAGTFCTDTGNRAQGGSSGGGDGGRVYWVSSVRACAGGGGGGGGYYGGAGGAATGDTDSSYAQAGSGGGGGGSSFLSTLLTATGTRTAGKPIGLLQTVYEKFTFIPGNARDTVLPVGNAFGGDSTNAARGLAGANKTSDSGSDGAVVFAWNRIPQWDAEDWPEAVELTIATGTVSSPISNFPVYVNMADLPYTFWNGVRSDCGDIRVTNSSNQELPREIVSCDTGTDTGELYFKANTIASSTATKFYIHYGNPIARNYGPGATYGSFNVWSEYSVVLHLNESRSTASGHYKDASGNGYHGTLTDANSNTGQAAGKLGNAIDFNGDADYLTISPSNRWTEFQNTFAITMWAKPYQTHGIDTQSTSGTGGTSGQRWLFYPFQGGSEAGGVGISFGTNGISTYEHGNSYLPALLVHNPATDTNWQHIAINYTAKQPSLYKNGTFVKNGLTSPRTYSILLSGDKWTQTPSSIGGGTYGYHDGEIDEFRIATTTRSAAWLDAEYENQNSPTTFYSVYDPAVEWNENDWPDRVEFVVQSEQVPDTLTDFPVYVDLSHLPRSTFWADVRTDCGDIRIMNSSLTAEMPREIVSCNVTDRTGELHFRANSLSSTTDTTFYIYYNNPSILDYDADQPYGRNSVWSNGYVAVWHMDDDPAGGAGSIIDSSGNGHNGTPNGSMTAGNVVAGALGSSLDFDAINDRIAIATSSAFQNTAFTISAWAYDDGGASATNTAYIFDASSNAYTSYGYGLSFDVNKISAFVGSASTYARVYTPLSQAVNGWTYAATTYSDTSDLITLYHNDQAATTTAFTSGIAHQSTARYIGGQVKAFNRNQRYFSGRIDEVRVASVERSAAWAKAEYRNQRSPGSFYRIVDSARSLSVNDWENYELITIAETNIDETLTQFPVYVDLSDLSSDFWANVNVDGSDIRVTNNAISEVPFELVGFNRAAQTGQLFFRADTVSASADTRFRIYYGNATAQPYLASMPNGSENVWSNGYLAVYHLEAVTATRGVPQYDSTRFHSTVYGAATTPRSTVGVLGDAQIFDGTNQTYRSSRRSHLELTSAISVSHWLRASSTQGNFARSLQYGCCNNATFGSYRFNFNGTSGTDLRALIASDATTGTAGGGVPNDSAFNLFTFTYGGGTLRHYQNETQVASANPGLTLGGYTGNNNGFAIGSNGEGSNKLIGYIDEVRVSSSTRSAAWIKAEYRNQNNTAGFFAVNDFTTTTLGNHSDKQVRSAFSFQNKDDESLYAFSLSPGASSTVRDVELLISNVNNLTTGTFSDVKLAKDNNSNTVFDAGDVVVSTGTLTINGASGSIVFTSDFSIDAETDFIVTADFNAPADGAFMKLDLYQSFITLDDEFSRVIVTGNVKSIVHQRNRSGGGSGVGAIGGAPPDTTPVGGGNQTGGDEAGSVDDGENFGTAFGFRAPAGQSGSWTSGASALLSDGVRATAASALTHTFSNFGISIPATNVVRGIAARIDASASTAAGTISLRLSWNNGTNDTEERQTATLTTSDTVYNLGGQTDLWGRSWVPADFADGSFVIEVTAAPSSNTLRLDGIEVRVYHEATGGGAGGGGAI